MKFNEENIFKFEASPIFWRSKAAQLKHAAAILEPSYENWKKNISQLIMSIENLDFNYFETNTTSIYLALLGFSIECLMKGIIIKNNPDLISNGKLSREITNHNLINLASKWDINLSKQEKTFCNTAIRAMVIDFRYPINKVMEEKKGYSVGGPNINIVFNDLYLRLYKMI